jgi:hypothetical protein
MKTYKIELTLEQWDVIKGILLEGDDRERDLADKLQEQMKNQPEELVEGYSRDDIRSLSEEPLTSDEVDEIFYGIDDNWDCNRAGNDIIRELIEETIERRKS